MFIGPILLLQISFHHIKLHVLINSRTLQYLLKYEQVPTKINGFLIQQITNYWPTITISKILELVVLGMRIAVNESSVSRVKQ